MPRLIPRLMPRLSLLLAVVLCAACSTSERGVETPAAGPLPEDRLDASRLEAHVRYLASDALMGRELGTDGIADAARYVAGQFEAAGARPLPGADGYLQHVPLVRVPGSRRPAFADALPEDVDTAAVVPIPAFNVAAWVEGADPARRDTFVVLMAHYDHVGAGMDRGPGATPADSIFNGARDNAMGVAALLGAAEALAARPPARSVLLLALTGEERGMLGSRYYVDHPLVPLERTIYAVNIDGAGYTDTSIVTLVGLGRTTADAAIREAAAAYRLAVIADPAPEQNLFDRSDNVFFARKGVPAPTFSPGFRSFTHPGVAGYYHRPQDEADDLDYGYLHRFVQAYARAARLIADAPVPPRWVEGDPYEAAAQALYGAE